MVPGWRSNFSAVRALEEENRRLRAEADRLKLELDRHRSDLLRTASAWRDERRWRIQAEHAWREGFSSFFRWIDNAIFGVTCFSNDGVAVQANRAVLRLLDYSREEYLGKRVEEVVADEGVVGKILEARNGGEVPEQYPVHLRAKNGVLKPVILSCQPFENGPMSGLCCHVQPLPRFERDRDRHQNHMIFRQLAGKMREVIWLTDVEKTRTCYISPAVEDILGISPETLYRNPTAFLEAIHPADRERVKAALPKQKTGEYCEEYRLLLRDGSTRWVRDRAIPVFNKAGEVYRVAGIVEDITALKGAEMTLGIRAKQQKALADLGRMAMEKPGMQEVFEETVELIAQTLDVEFCKILEVDPETNDFLMRACVGWPAEMVGRAKISHGEASQAAFTLASEYPVVVDNLMAERRFEGAGLLWNWGARSGITVRIGQRNRPYGVLGVHSRVARSFSHDDVHFVEAAANLLAATLDRVAAEARQEKLSLELIIERQRLNDILATVPGIVWELQWDDVGKEMTITFVSDHVEALTGFPREMWVGNTDFWVKRLHPDDREEVLANIRRGFEGGEMAANSRCRLISAKNETIWLESRKQIFRDCAGKPAGLRGVLVNITPQVQAEMESRTASERFRSFMDHTPVIAFIKDTEGRYVYGNKSFDEMVYRMQLDWMNKTDDELFPADTATWFRTHDLIAINEDRTVQSIEIKEDEKGRPRYWAVFKFPLTDNKGEKCIGAVGVDITERRQLEQEILQISDREQRRMGQDLHDGICQHLLGLALMSSTLADKMERDEQPRGKEVRDISQLLYDAVGLARGLMRGLHLVNLEGGGLASALEEFCQTTSRLFGKNVELSIPRNFVVSDRDLATHLFRITQEATNNAIKHGNAALVTVVADEHEGGLRITVVDDGVGLPEEIPDTGMGIQTMKYRAELIGATLLLENREAGGAMMECHLAQRPEIVFE